MDHSNEADLFWKTAPATLKWKLIVLDAAIHPKILYGVETLVISQSDYDKIDAFQIRVFRTNITLITVPEKGYGKRGTHFK